VPPHTKKPTRNQDARRALAEAADELEQQLEAARAGREAADELEAARAEKAARVTRRNKARPRRDER